MTNARIAARRLAAAFLAGKWSKAALSRRGGRACGGRARWLPSLISRTWTHYGDAPQPPDEQLLTAFLAADSGLLNAVAIAEPPVLHLVRYQSHWPIPRMQPRVAAPWPIPALATPAALADWLGLTVGQLEWFADCQRRLARATHDRLRHYNYRWIPKRDGKGRLLEMPRFRLKAIQRRILHDLLDPMPLHEAAHGFRRGRSVVSYTAPHAGQVIVLRFDLCDFFPSIRASRIHALYRTAGYPAPVARLLTGLCTSEAPEGVWDDLPPDLRAGTSFTARQRFRSSHLPQGAPTSPALANLCAFRLDRRLNALASRMEARYTRYADDLAFSGGAALERACKRFQVGVCRIALEEGFEVRTRKSRFMRQGVRQQLAGVVLNVRPNVARAEIDQLKAILTNCIRHGPATQNRDNHADFREYLTGRIGYVAQINATRGRRLRVLFERIAWETGVG